LGQGGKEKRKRRKMRKGGSTALSEGADISTGEGNLRNTKREDNKETKKVEE